MRTVSVLAAALVAVSSVVASEDGARPKFYFPRHVKRQFTNGTITSEETVPPSSLSETRRQTDSEKEPSGDPNVTTVIISSTIYVSPPPPTPTPDSTSSTESTSDSSSSSESSSESSSAAQSSSDNSSSSDSSSASSTEAATSSSSSAVESSAVESSAAETSTAETSAVETSTSVDAQPSSSEVPPTSSSSSAAAETTSSPVAEPTTSTPVAEPTTSTPVAEPTTSTPVAEPTTTTPVVEPTTTTPEPVATSSSVVVSTSEEPAVPTTSTSEIVIAPTGIVTSSSTSEPSNPLTSILSDINSVISSILEPSPTESTIPSSAITGPGTGISTETPTVTEPPATATETSTTIPDVTSSDPGQPPISNSTIPATETNTATVTPEPPLTTSTSIPDPGTNATSTFTEPPVITSSSIISGNNSVPTGNSTVPPETTLPPTTVTDSSSSRPSESGVTNITPLSTFTTSEPWLPSTIIVAPSSSSATGKTPTTASGIPTTFPSAIAPNNGVTSTPDDTMLIQIGFREGYNYPFVVDNDRAAAQVFKLLPQALSEAAGFDMSKAQVKRLVPLDTLNTLGYITTCAVVSYPINMVETLSIDIKLPNAPLYNNRDQLIYNLTQQINPAIPIVLGAYPDGLGGVAGATPGVNTPGGSANSDPFGTSGDNNSGGQSGTQRGTTAGIVSGAVAVAAAYGVVMFVLARRYKRKKQSHRRASSISSPSEMSEVGRGSPALMGGALLSRDFTSSYGAVQPGERNSHGSGRSGMGNSGRTQFISAPVAAENSLGWN